MSRSFPAVRRNPLPALIAFVILGAIALLRFWLGGDEPIAPPPEPVAEGEYRVEHVIDGDTFRLDDGRSVRLIGIDCPEIFTKDADNGERDYSRPEPWATDATAFTEGFIGDGNVDLQFDRERVDQYDRVLAYVYRDGRLLNEELLRAGLGEARLHFHYADRYKRLFKKAEQQAREERRGIWSGKN